MKKKWSHAIFRVEIRKWGRIMLVNLILVLLSGVSLYAQNESSRQQRITAKYQNKTILEVLEDLKAKTGYTFGMFRRAVELLGAWSEQGKHILSKRK